MKNRLIALFLFLTVVSCLPKKKSDIEPDLAGTYQASLITTGPTTLNLPDGKGNSANAVITRLSDSQINMILNLTINGSTRVFDFGMLTTRKASGKEYDVLDPTTSARIGSINGTDFTLDFLSNGQRFVLVARK